jgi:outer membrane receptor protein involved in Fe transport
VPGFTASLDYYRIEIDDGIVEPAPQSIVDGCYNLPPPDNAPFCAKLFRSPVTGGFNAGPTVGVEVARVNAGFESAEGIDIAAGYAFGVAGGELAFNLQATYMIEQVIQDAPGLPRNDCAGLVGNRCLRPYNEWNAILTSRWTSGPLTVQVDTRLITGVEQDAIAFGDFSADDFAIDEIPTFVYWDLRGQYDINDQWTVRAGIENFFDREPPIVGAFWGGTAENSGNTFPSVYDALGRAFTLGVTARF